MIRALILDYGEVLSRPQRAGSLEAMAARLGVPVEAFAAAYWSPRRDYDLGLAVDAYWTRVTNALGRPAPDAAALEWLIARDVESWTDYREEMWTLARRFREPGGRTGILSNGVPEIMAHVRRQRRLDDWFDAVVVSFEVGHVKPDPAIYSLTLDRLGASPAETLFVDDRAENIEAASRLGLQTVHFAGDASIAAVRAALGQEG